jgi:DNA-binding GntR family transcriptional regulator
MFLIQRLKVNQSEHAELMNLALERDKNGISKLIENHIMTPVEIIKKSLSQL